MRILTTGVMRLPLCLDIMCFNEILLAVRQWVECLQLSATKVGRKWPCHASPAGNMLAILDNVCRAKLTPAWLHHNAKYLYICSCGHYLFGENDACPAAPQCQMLAIMDNMCWPKMTPAWLHPTAIVCNHGQNVLGEMTPAWHSSAKCLRLWTMCVGRE